MTINAGGDKRSSEPRPLRRADDEGHPGARVPPVRTELRLAAGCLVAAAALLGLAILAGLIAIALEPPVWVQVLVGVGLVGGGAGLAWLVASALGSRRPRL